MTNKEQPGPEIVFSANLGVKKGKLPHLCRKEDVTIVTATHQYEKQQLETSGLS